MLAEHQERLIVLTMGIERIAHFRAQDMKPSPSLSDCQAFITAVKSDMELCGLAALFQFWRSDVSFDLFYFFLF